MKSIYILLSLEIAELMLSSNKNSEIVVHYKDAEIKDGSFLVGAYGCGEDIDEACDDYLSKIRGKTLVFNAGTKNRREVTVLG